MRTYTEMAIDRDLAADFAAVAGQMGCELLHVELDQRVLRVILDRPEGGVTVEDCAKVSKQLSALLDVTDVAALTKSHYTLEVSSPGLDRRFYSPDDFKRFCGQKVRVIFRSSPTEKKQTEKKQTGKKQTGKKQTEKKQTVVGWLEQYYPGEEAISGSIDLRSEAPEREHHIELADIELARLEIEI